MTRIIMLKTQAGTENGFTITSYESGQEYEVSDSLLKAFVSLGCCEIVTEKTPVVETKIAKPVKEKKTKAKAKAKKTSKKG
jgi:hypothetical protein